MLNWGHQFSVHTECFSLEHPHGDLAEAAGKSTSSFIHGHYFKPSEFALAFAKFVEKLKSDADAGYMDSIYRQNKEE